MAQASPKTKRIRRLKRDRSLLLRIANRAIQERDQARIVANAALKEIDNLNKKLNPETEVKVVNEDVENNQVNRPNENGSGLEVS